MHRYQVRRGKQTAGAVRLLPELRRNVVGYWPLRDNAGVYLNSFPPETTGANDGASNTGLPSQAVAEGLNGTYFSGAQYLYLGTAAAPSTATLVVSFSPVVVDATNRGLFSKATVNGSDGSNIAHSISYSSSGVRYRACTTGTIDVLNFTAPVALTAGKTYSICVVQRGANLPADIWVNGVLEATATQTASSVVNGGRHWKVGVGPGAVYANAVIAEAGVWSFPVSSQMAQHLSSSPSAPYTPRRIWAPQVGITGLPILSLPTYVPSSLTASGFRPRVTAS